MNTKAQETAGGLGFIVKAAIVLIFLTIILAMLYYYVFPKLTAKGFF